VARPISLSLLAQERGSGVSLALPDQLASTSLEIRLPVPAIELGPGEQFAWLMEVDGPDRQFFGYARPPAVFDPATNQLVLSIPANQLHDLLFLPVRLHPAFVRNMDADMHVWSSPFADAVDFGVAAPQFTRMEVLAPQLGGRLLVLNAFTALPGWVDSTGVGPVAAVDGLPPVLPPPADELPEG
jgi:hypothetical protein